MNQNSELIISDQLAIDWKKICLVGNRWHHNFGDELICIGLIKLLIKHNVEDWKLKALYVSCGDSSFLKEFYRYFFSEQELKYIHYIQEIPHGFRSWWRFLTSKLTDLWTYFRCDTFIIGWGELFTEETPGSYLYWFVSLFPFWLRSLFKPTRLYVMWGMQEPRTWYNKLLLKWIVKSTSACFLRDEESVDAAKKTKHMLPSSATWAISRFIDTSYFALDYVTLQKNNIKDNQKTKHIIVNTNPLSTKWTAELSDIVWQYHVLGYQVYFLPAFFTSNPQQDDMACYELLKKQHNFIQLLDRRNWDQFIPLFMSTEKIFCSRLHVFLVAAFLDKDVQAYPYQKKISKNREILKRSWVLKE